MLLGADTKFVLHDDPAILDLARQVVRQRLGLDHGRNAGESDVAALAPHSLPAAACGLVVGQQACGEHTARVRPSAPRSPSPRSTRSSAKRMVKNSRCAGPRNRGLPVVGGSTAQCLHSSWCPETELCGSLGHRHRRGAAADPPLRSARSWMGCRPPGFRPASRRSRRAGSGVRSGPSSTQLRIRRSPSRNTSTTRPRLSNVSPHPWDARSDRNCKVWPSSGEIREENLRKAPYRQPLGPRLENRLNGVCVALRNRVNPPSSTITSQPPLPGLRAERRSMPRQRHRNTNQRRSAVVQPAHRIRVLGDAVARERFDEQAVAIGFQCSSRMASRTGRVRHIVQAIEKPDEVKVRRGRT